MALPNLFDVYDLWTPFWTSGDTTWTAAQHWGYGVEAAIIVVLVGIAVTAVVAYYSSNSTKTGQTLLCALGIAVVAFLAGPITFVFGPIILGIMAVVVFFSNWCNNPKLRNALINAAASPFKWLVNRRNAKLNKVRKQA